MPSNLFIAAKDYLQKDVMRVSLRNILSQKKRWWTVETECFVKPSYEQIFEAVRGFPLAASNGRAFLAHFLVVLC